MTVYVDLVFLTNLAVDGTVLLTTAKVRRLAPKPRNIAISAATGALYAAFMFVADIPYLYSFAVKIAVSALMVGLAFGYGGPVQWARNFGAFYAVNFATLGGVLGIAYLLRTSGTPWGGMRFTPDGGLLLDWHMQLGMFALAFALSVWLFRGVSETRRRRDGLETALLDVTVTIDGVTRSCKGLVDTGNRLYDPLTRIPVMLMEASLWREELPDRWAERLQGEPADRLVAELDGRPDYRWADRVRLVPYRGAGGNVRLMLALKPDEVVVMGGDLTAPACCRRILIGLDGGTLSSEGAFRAVLHPDMAAAAPSQPA